MLIYIVYFECSAWFVFRSVLDEVPKFDKHLVCTQLEATSQAVAVALDRASPFLMEVHAAHGGGVSVQGVYAFSRLSIPDFQRSVCRSTDDDIVPHLRGPDSARVPNQCSQTLKRNGLLRYPFDRAERKLKTKESRC